MRRSTRPADGSRPRGTRRSWRRAGLAVALALAFAGLDRLGVFNGPERRSVDARMTLLPRPARPMTDRIVHVDIDDSALARLGGWPWDRATIADAVDELRRAGAATIALDLIFSDERPAPSGGMTGAATGARTGAATGPVSDSDGQFAAALARARAVVPVLLHEPPVFDDDWKRGDGPAELERLLRVLAEDVQQGEDEVVERAGLTGSRSRRYRAQPLAFKHAAAWRALAASPQVEWEAFEAELTPRRSVIAGAYPERAILRSAWTRDRAWRALAPRLVRPDGSAGTHLDMPPLPRLAAAASAVGFVNVNARRHPDGRVRELPVFRAAPGGIAVQFGLAAALAHAGIDPASLREERGALVAGNVRLPLCDGKLWIAWPTSDTTPRWKGLLRPADAGADAPSEAAGHLSIREVVELARARRTRTRLAGDLATVTKLVFAGAQIDPGDRDLLDDDTQRLVADEVDFTLAEAPPADESAGLDAAFRDHLHNCRAWRELTAAITDADTRIAAASGALRAAVDGRLVFVGWTATAVAADFCATAIGPSTPGVVVHAALADMVLTGRHVAFLPPVAAVGLVLLPALACGLLAVRCSALASTFGAGVISLAYAVAAVGLFARFDLAIPVVAPLTAAAAVWITGTAIEAWRSQRERLRITRQFKSRVSGDLVDYLVANPGAVTVDGTEREVTVLFGDLAGFTSMSEALGGPGTVAMLNRYLKGLADVLVANGAYVNKFLGDGLMAFWSAFEPDPAQARRACASIAACRTAMDALNAESRVEGLPELDLRIGIATGRVVVGDCGAPPSMHDYTAIGDAVNLAARLETANKQFGTTNLIDGRTRALLGDDAPDVRPVGRISVVGQTAAVDAYEIMPAGCPGPMLELCRRVVDAFTAGRLDEADAALETLEASFGPTRWSGRFRRAIGDIAEAGAEAFDGTLRLSEK